MTASEPSAEGGHPSSPYSVPGCVTIRCRENGPLVVEMPAEGGLRLRVTDHEGHELPLPDHKRAVALCRCGHTATRPFCDGSHKTAGITPEKT
ncbi:MAG: CDGSH iron-sulfur domain-containing protein [Planctomycetia bacterium]|nr:CDGSH iron-sulfur domain-containing protein [Planctomycetia bacterium]